MAGNIQRKLTIGIHPLSYLGVNAESPPNSVLLQNQDPTTSDWQNFIIGDLWINLNGSPTPPNPRIWMLGALERNSATWILIANGTGGDVSTLTGNSGGAVGPLLGNINVVGDGTTINIVGNPATHTLTVSTVGTGVLNTLTASDATVATPIAGNITFPDAVIAGSGNVDSNLESHGAAGNFTINLKPRIQLPATNNTGTQGAIFIGGGAFAHSANAQNTFVGGSAGNFALTGIENVGVGNTALNALTTGQINTAVGWAAMAQATTGSNNTALGTAALAATTTGNSNLAVGAGSLTFLATGSGNLAITGGTNYTSTESNNILIYNTGVALENNTIRIGTDGGGAGQQNRCFIAGIAGITTGVADAVAVLISASTSQLGTVSSSSKYKTNIEDMADQSEIIYDLKPKTFNFKKHPDIPAWGLIAEEVERIFPQLVVYKDNEPETVKYHELVPLMLNEIIKLNKRIKSLEAKVCA